MVLVGYA
ncbi:Protein of unknown function [Bacillus wiedmannii]|nr:Protein of unknown function [Bacillus wiedmannii]